ncbi:hypothetical protein [Microbispora hainanensis]|uniref:Uncharacterized protein n=1 Tax=Microbispora hainanensis TaxID=568844 RepID=A0ABZ1SL91_9ACTN|nr:hypothetical protein [Microbispora hainanensis]
MAAEDSMPCRHAGAPPQTIVDSVSALIRDLGAQSSLLNQYGLTTQEYTEALPAAIEGLRGSMSASVADRKAFLATLFQGMLAKGTINDLEKPNYGDDTVYRLTIAGFGDVAVIQKGCPDGKHSSVQWSAPAWARETYLWWLCDSMRYEPGEHLSKGVNRLRQRFFGDYPDTVDGVIFHNHLCGTGQRPCPKIGKAARVGNVDVPPPCVYVMPDRAEDATEWNWDGGQHRFFPGVLLSAFGISPEQALFFTGYIGFQKRAGTLHTTITSRFGPGRVVTFRN